MTGIPTAIRYPADDLYVVRSMGVNPARGREPCVPLRRCSDRNRGIFAATDLGAVVAFHFSHDRHRVPRCDARGEDDVDLVEADAGRLERRAPRTCASTPPTNERTILSVTGTVPGGWMSPVAGSGLTSPRPSDQIVTTPQSLPPAPLQGRPNQAPAPRSLKSQGYRSVGACATQEG